MRVFAILFIALYSVGAFENGIDLSINIDVDSTQIEARGAKLPRVSNTKIDSIAMLTTSIMAHFNDAPYSNHVEIRIENKNISMGSRVISLLPDSSVIYFSKQKFKDMKKGELVIPAIWRIGMVWRGGITVVQCEGGSGDYWLIRDEIDKRELKSGLLFNDSSEALVWLLKKSSENNN